MATDPNSVRDRYEMRRERRPTRPGLTGPVLLIALGIMFLVGQFVPALGVGRTWPVILIIIGLVKVIESVWSRRSTRPN